VEREPITRAGLFAGAYAVDFDMFASGDDGYIATGAIEGKSFRAELSKVPLHYIYPPRIGSAAEADSYHFWKAYKQREPIMIRYSTTTRASFEQG